MAERKLRALGVDNSPKEPIRVCEICGKTGVANPFLNFILVIGVAGHWSVPPIQCDHTEHWACNIEHWLEVAHACVEEHGHQLLVNSHKDLEGSEHQDYAKKH